MDSEHSLFTIQAMRKQEESAYTVHDYLASLPLPTGTVTPVDGACRQVMANWCCEIAVFCKYERETVAIALNMLDRWMSTPDGFRILLDRNLYQLASMTALYTAVKVHEQEAMDPALVSSLSRGVHSAQAVETMEARMLQALQWRVNPPTAMSYVRLAMNIVPGHLLAVAERETIQEIARFQLEQSVTEYEFCRYSPSTMALASLLNALEGFSTDGMFYDNFEATMGQVLGVTVMTPCLRDLRIALYELMNDDDAAMVLQSPVVESSNACNKNMESTSSGEPVAVEYRFFNNSPRSVSV